MKIFAFLLFFIGFFVNSAFAENVNYKELNWNRYTSKNFVILSLDNEQGKWTNQHIEQIKTWCVTRWGFSDFEFSRECRIFCVPNKELLKKTFSIEESTFNAKEDILAAWLVLDEDLSLVISKNLTYICLSEYEKINKVDLGFWFKRGCAELNSITPEIRKKLSEPRDVRFFTQNMFYAKEEDYIKLSLVDRKLFDKEAMFLCLFLRKEFGEAKLHGFLRMSSANSLVDVFKTQYGFKGFPHFYSNYGRFQIDLTKDISLNKTPDYYLEIKPVNYR